MREGGDDREGKEGYDDREDSSVSVVFFHNERLGKIFVIKDMKIADVSILWEEDM